MEFIRSTIKRKTRGLSSGESVCSPDEKKQKESQESSGDIIPEAFNMAEGLAEKVDLILSKLSKLDKLDQIEVRLDNLTTSVSSIEMSVSRLEKEVSALDSKTKTIEKSVNELKESVSFCEDEIEEVKKNAYDIKEDCSSDIDDLGKQILYLEHYSRRENLKFVGIPERTISADEDDDRSSEDTKALVYKFMEDELAIEIPQQKIEFQRIHCLGKSAKNGPRPILARFLRYPDREEVLQLARSKLKDSDFAVYEDIPKELYDIRKAQMHKVKAAKKKDDTTYTNLITSKYSDWLNEFKDVNDKRVLWDLIKYRIRQVSMKYSKEKAKELRARLVEAEQKVTQCDLICNTDPSEKNIYNLETAKYEYELLYDYCAGKYCQQLTDSLNYSFENGELSNTQKQAVIRLIDKKDRDRRYIKNWRPISLLNVDVKIVSKALALRLEKFLPEIIHPHQYAYVKGRTIFDAVRTIDDIMEYTKIKQLPGLMVALDFEKAFDSLSWPFLFKALKSFNFGESFIKWVSTLYSNISSCVINNGFATHMFEVRRGVRQGDPLSAYLFIVALEILLIKIRCDKNIRGIMVENKEIKLAAFADDLTTFLQGFKSFQRLSKVLDGFGTCSGLKLNAEKTEAGEQVRQPSVYRYRES
ncbi:hypothetical protein ACROYT_G018919 [Oculina patagonica]